MKATSGPYLEHNTCPQSQYPEAAYASAWKGGKIVHNACDQLRKGERGGSHPFSTLKVWIQYGLSTCALGGASRGLPAAGGMKQALLPAVTPVPL